MQTSSPLPHVLAAVVLAAGLVGCAASHPAAPPPPPVSAASTAPARNADDPVATRLPATAPSPEEAADDPAANLPPPTAPTLVEAADDPAANLPPVTAPPPVEVADDPAADLLSAIEESGLTLEGFTATIYYETKDALLGQKVIRQGSILFRRDPDTGDKSFAILFDSTIVDRRKQRHPKHIIFRDGWLVEIDHENRQFVKRQVVAPGEDVDPLRLGEGPIPLPIDQTRDSVLKRFHASLIDLPEDGPLARLRVWPVVDGLHLVPREGASVAKDFASVDLFFDRETRLPAGVIVNEPNGNRKTARLTDIRRNPPFDAEDLAKLDIAEPRDEGWRIDVRPLENR